MKKNTRKAPKLLLILVVGWVFLWILLDLYSGGWLPGLSWLTIMIVVPAVIYGIALIIPSIIVVILSLFKWLARKEQPHIIAFLPLLIMLAFYFLPTRIPSKPAVTFHLHRDEFIRVAESSVSELQDTDKREFRLSESPLYEDAWVYREFSSKALVAEFTVGSYSLPLVYVSTDNPGDTYSACPKLEDDGPSEKLEPKWYVCMRDWP